MANVNSDNMLKPLDWPPIRVDVQVSAEALAAMLANVEETFQHLEYVDEAQSKSLEGTYRAAFLTERDDQFYESGKVPVRQFVATLARHGLEPKQIETVFELGCGLGRSTIWLAERFKRVIAADVSAPHLRATQQTAAKYGRKNVEFVHTNSFDALKRIPRFDALFSIVVLQHNPPPVIRHVLDTLLTRLNTGGMAYFQVPTYRLNYEFDADKYLRSAQNLRIPPMHVLPQPELFALLEERGCRLVEIREDSSAGGQNISSRVLVQKR